MKHLIIALIFFSSQNVKSQLFVQNDYSEPFKVAIGFYESGVMYKGWITKGWLEIQPGETKEVLHVNPTKNKIYYYAFSEQTNLEGQYKLLVHPDSTFRIKDANFDRTKLENENLIWLNFNEINRGISSSVQNKFTIKLAPKKEDN